MVNRITTCVASILLVAAAAGCTALSGEQVARARSEIVEAELRGDITAAQADALLAQLDAEGGWDWSTLGEIGIAVGGSVLFALTGVRLHRGPAQRLPAQSAPVLAALVAERKAAGAVPGEATPPAQVP